MIKKKEFYKWERIRLIEDKTYPHISFVTAYYFLGIPVYKYEKYIPNKIDEFDVEENKGGFTETIPMKKTGAYNPAKDDAKKMEGAVEAHFE